MESGCSPSGYPTCFWAKGAQESYWSLERMTIKLLELIDFAINTTEVSGTISIHEFGQHWLFSLEDLATHMLEQATPYALRQAIRRVLFVNRLLCDDISVLEIFLVEKEKRKKKRKSGLGLWRKIPPPMISQFPKHMNISSSPKNGQFTVSGKRTSYL